MENSMQNLWRMFWEITHSESYRVTKQKGLTLTRLHPFGFFVVAILSLLILSGCDSDSDELLLEDKSIHVIENDIQLSTNVESPAVYDGATGGLEGFYFLPPMVKSPSFSGTFDASLSPVVEIYEKTTSEVLHVSFTMDQGSGSEVVRMDEEDENYIVNWHTDQTGAVVGRTYRIRIKVAGAVLGHADVVMAENGKEAKNLSDGEAIALVDGKTLPIKFRVEKEAINIVGPEGGVIIANDGLVNLTIPEDAIGENLNITVESVEDDLDDPDVVPGALFDFGPSPYSFNKDLTLTIKYDPANLPVGVSEDELRLLAVVNGEWVQLPGSSVNSENNTVTGPLSSFSRKGVGRGKVQEISVSPSEASITVGETVQFEAVLKDVDGQLISRNVQWSSSNDAISTVDKAGLVTAISLGESTIEAKSGRISGTAGLIVADGNSSKAFITKWDTNLYRYDTRIALALGGTVNATIDWGDGSSEENVTSPGPHYHTYAVDGVYIVSVTGTVTAYNNRQYGGSLSDKQKLIEVLAWGDVGFNNFSYAFERAQNLQSVPSNSIGIENVFDMKYMFNGTYYFNTDIGDWNTENVTNMMSMFSGSSSFNQNIGDWNTGNVTNMRSMFSGSSSFNQDIGNWNTSNVTDMQGMFDRAANFNQNIGAWETGNVTNMSYMFSNTSRFNQEIGQWNTEKVTNMEGMFSLATAFRGNIADWNTQNVTNMKKMFLYASYFNQDIGNWDTGKVTTMRAMFADAGYFNQDISAWDTGSVVDMDDMFIYSRNFNQDLSKWCVSNVMSKPANFDTGATNWVLPRPVWGTCPTN